jgi:hypothetical protein
MTWIRLRKSRSAHRVTAINDLQFPASGRHRLASRHPHLGDDDIRLVEAATRQWFRLVASHRRTKLSMPSVAVDDLWQELALHTRDYAAFCDTAFGRVPRQQPGSAISTAAADTDRTHLRSTPRPGPPRRGLPRTSSPAAVPAGPEPSHPARQLLPGRLRRPRRVLRGRRPDLPATPGGSRQTGYPARHTWQQPVQPRQPAHRRRRRRRTNGLRRRRLPQLARQLRSVSSGPQ